MVVVVVVVMVVVVVEVTTGLASNAICVIQIRFMTYKITVFCIQRSYPVNIA